MFTTATLDFLDELATHNDRAWFDANRHRYEALVREPALAFIVAMAPALARIAPRFRADARKVGGSLMRVNRDTRFARDKSPYKTNVGIQFRHEQGKDVHAPGFYVHVATDESFLGVGCWHPEPAALGRIRDRIARKPGPWLALRDAPAFGAHWTLSGDALTRTPRGYAADHPAAADLRRKDFVGIAPIGVADIVGPDLPQLATERFAAAVPFVRFLCAALDVRY